MDRHTPEQRSRNMSAIRSRNTAPEIRVRSLLHSLGFRFRIHPSNLPGKPDIVLPKHRTVIFVNGCFWHCHRCLNGRRLPATNSKYWSVKRAANVARDRRNVSALKAALWDVITIWECNTLSEAKIVAALGKLRLPRLPDAK
jgi:DNA mismatch endonuclease, patch repair protein